jgi:hypothetical protein
MSGGGAKPGERRGGRKTGTPNKRTLARQAIEEEAKEAVAETAAAVPTAALMMKALVAQRKIAMTLMGMAATEQRKEKPDVGRLQSLLEAAARVWKDIAPYEDRRLGQIGFDVEALLNKQDGTLHVHISATEADF